MRKIYIAIFFFLSTQVAFSTDYYWVENGGDWKDASHWSLTSGGSTSGVVPTLDDNVFFDANSFTLPGQIVYILDDGSNVGVVFKTIDWRNVTNNPTFQIKRVTSDYVYNQCYGSLYFSDNMVLDFDGAEFYMASSANYEFDTRGLYMGQNCWLQFNSEAPVTGNILSDINHAWIYFNQGTVNFNGHSFFGINNSNNVEQQNYPTIWLANGTATLNVSNSLIDVGAILFGNGSTLIDDNSTLRIRNRFQADNHDFNYVVFDSVLWNGGGANTFQNLEILPGSVVKFASAVTQTINNLVVSGTRQNPIYISSMSPGNAATIQKSSGTIDISWAHLQDIVATGGATFNAHGSWNDGNVTGWNFKLDELDLEALNALYTSTNGSGWINNAPWDSSPTDSRIVVDNGSPTASGGRVTSILLNNNNLTGVLNGELANLDSVVSVDLSGNTLTGNFPVVLTDLHLTSLNLSGNQFIGAVPSLELTSLSSLIDLDLANNSFDELPDMTTMPFLTTLNVSGNNFDFEDLGQNASIIVDDGVGFYQDQAPVSTASYNEIPVNSDTTMTIPVGGINNVYQWKFKSKTDQSYNPIGANEDMYTINSINRSTMGDYMLEITNPDIPGLVLTSAVHTVAATADISGTLLENNALPVSSGIMRLLRVTSVGSYDTVGIEAINENGGYFFDNVVLDDYLVNGYPDTLVAAYLKALPTYFEKTIFWEEADTLKLEDNITDLDITAEFKPDPPISGPGEITGTFYENVPGGRTSAKARVSKAPVTVRRVQGSGRGKEEVLTLVAHTFTDENGEFTFTKLDEAEYRFNVQLPGYPMDVNSYVTIPIVDNLFDRQVGIEAEVIEGKIEVRKLVITGWQEETHSFSIYPNPSVDFLYLKGKGIDRNLQFQLMDATGKDSNVPIKWNANKLQWELSIKGFQRGIYFLRVHKDGKSETVQVMVQ